jgi:hypothetical protein
MKQKLEINYLYNAPLRNHHLYGIMMNPQSFFLESQPLGLISRALLKVTLNSLRIGSCPIFQNSDYFRGIEGQASMTFMHLGDDLHLASAVKMDL